MGLANELLTKIQQLGRFDERSETVSVSDGGDTISCRLQAVDQLACSFDELALETDRLAGATLDTLGRISEELSRRLTYLLEPVAPIERDAERCIVQMRSKPPARDDDGTRYYELIVERGRLSLVRYQRTSGAARQKVAAQVTLEVLGRLAADFAAVAVA